MSWMTPLPWRLPLAPASIRERGLPVRLPAHRLVRHLEMRENFLVEILRAVEQLLHLAEKHARFRALDDAMVVGAGDRHDLADAEGEARTSGATP
jgi:hypothetical protein